MGKRLGLVGVLVVIASVTVPAAAQAAQSAQARLAAAYSPVLALESQQQPCGSGEPYRPTSVSTVLGKEGVTLRGPDGKVVKNAPTAADLFGRTEGYYLDLPGDPLRPGCTYETEFKRWNGGRPPVVYAHVARDAAHPDRLAVQYWLFYVFNDFTDKHEGDWEMAQVDFRATTPEQALRDGPYEVDVAQHAGGERAAWSARKLAKQGDHQVIYVATGSHASYFGRALYLGRSASAGFGCDDTRKDTTRIEPQTKLLPQIPASAPSPDAWLGFWGRWGQKERGINNGPTGPAAKGAWYSPIVWADGLRDTSVRVPGTGTLGPSVTGFFCGAVSRVSVTLTRATIHPWIFLAVLAIVVLALVSAAHRTRWRPPDPRPVRISRRGGQILRASGRLYFGNWRTFVAVGVIFIPISLVTMGAQWVLFHLTPLGAFVALDGRRGAITTLLALLIGNVGAVCASVVTTAAVAAALSELAAGRDIRGKDAYRAAFKHLRALTGAFIRLFGMLLLLTITVIGIPFAVHRFIRWSLFTQTCVLEDRSARGSLRSSSELVRGRWWRSFGFTALVDILVIVSGPILGVALLLLTDRSLDFINVAGSVVHTLTVPYAAIALTLYYFELVATRQREEPGLRRSDGSQTLAHL